MKISIPIIREWESEAFILGNGREREFPLTPGLRDEIGEEQGLGGAQLAGGKMQWRQQTYSLGEHQCYIDFLENRRKDYAIRSKFELKLS